MTEKGLEALTTQLDELKNVKRPKLVERLANARAEGDLKENSDYQNAKDELAFMDGKIEELEDVVKNAVIVKTNGNANQVAVGTKVLIKANDTEHTFEIVGEWEADPVKKKISHSSPLGAALVGRKVGDKTEVEAPAGKVTYEVLSIG